MDRDIFTISPGILAEMQSWPTERLRHEVDRLVSACFLPGSLFEDRLREATIRVDYEMPTGGFAIRVRYKGSRQWKPTVITQEEARRIGANRERYTWIKYGGTWDVW